MIFATAVMCSNEGKSVCGTEGSCGVSSRYGTQVAILAHKCLYLLSHLDDPGVVSFKGQRH